MKVTQHLIIRFFVSLFISFTYPLLIKVSPEGVSNYWHDALISFFFTFTIWEGNFRWIHTFRNKYPKIEQTKVRIIGSIGASVLYTLLVVFAGFGLLMLRYHFSLRDIPTTNILLISIFITAVIGAIYESYYFLGMWKGTVLEAERLKGEQVASAYALLKQQVNPDFLFNSLHVLEKLIDEEPQAMDFTEKLSQTYRYILQHKDEELVDLKTEVNFVKQYLSLLQYQLTQPLQVQWQIIPDAYHQHIIPFCLQYLLTPILSNSAPASSPAIHIIATQTTNLKIHIQDHYLREPIERTLLPLQEKYIFLTNQIPRIITFSDHSIEIQVPLLSTEQLG